MKVWQRNRGVQDFSSQNDIGLRDCTIGPQADGRVLLDVVARMGRQEMHEFVTSQAAPK